jgi:hypothetical protein
MEKFRLNSTTAPLNKSPVLYTSNREKKSIIVEEAENFAPHEKRFITHELLPGACTKVKRVQVPNFQRYPVRDMFK